MSASSRKSSRSTFRATSRPRSGSRPFEHRAHAAAGDLAVDPVARARARVVAGTRAKKRRLGAAVGVAEQDVRDRADASREGIEHPSERGANVDGLDGSRLGSHAEERHHRRDGLEAFPQLGGILLDVRGEVLDRRGLVLLLQALPASQQVFHGRLASHVFDLLLVPRRTQSPITIGCRLRRSGRRPGISRASSRRGAAGGPGSADHSSRACRSPCFMRLSNWTSTVVCASGSAMPHIFPRQKGCSVRGEVNVICQISLRDTALLTLLAI